MITAGRVIVGRDVELEALDRLLEPATGLRLLVLEGEAGIGKTTLWRSAIGRARDAGQRTLVTAGVPAEAQLAASGIRDLLGEAFPPIEARLSRPLRHALAVLLLRDDPGGTAPDQGTFAAAVLAALRVLAADRPTLLAVDDVQWLDPASATLLGYALRRLGDAPLAVLLARRTEAGQPVTPPLGLPRETDVPMATTRLGPLSVGATASMLGSLLGTPIPRPTLHRLHGASGGNPLFALELARALGAAPAALGPDDALPVPDTLRELVTQRLAALPETTLDALLLVASLAVPTEALLARALDGDPSSALRPAEEAQVVERAPDDGVRFTHPLLAAAVLDRASPARRAALHAWLATIVEDAEARARHLALGTREPDPEVAEAIERGARLAQGRGSPSAAAELAAHARRLTPPAEREAVDRRALLEAEGRFGAGETSRAGALLDEVLATSAPGPIRARMLARRARIRHFEDDIAASVALLGDALDDAGDDAALRGEISEGLAWGLLLVRGDLRAAHEHARVAARAGEVRGDPTALAEGLAVEALTAFALGRPWRATMDRAVALEPHLPDLRTLRHPSFALGYALACSDDLAAADAVFADLTARAAQAGDESSMPSILNHRSTIAQLAGRLDAAASLAAEARDRARDTGQRPALASALGRLAIADAHRGHLDAARANAREALQLAGDGTSETSAGPATTPPHARGGEAAIHALGLVALLAGDPAVAADTVTPLVRTLLDAGVGEPGEARMLPDAIEALVALGRLDEADGLVRALETWTARVDRPSVTGLALRSRGLILAAQGDADPATAALEAAVRHHAAAPIPLELARSQLALGIHLRRQRARRAAREQLGAGRATFAAIGARAWVERTDAEIARIGGRAPGTDGLTPTELAVARLVADGRSNREAAETLVLSVHTIEAALTQVYAKLGVRSRSELARRADDLG